MSLVIHTIVLEVVVLLLLDWYGSNAFPGLETLDIPDNNHQWRSLRRRQLLCREYHIVESMLFSLAAVILECYTRGDSLWPLLAAFGALESTWLLLTYVIWPPAHQKFTDWPRFLLAQAAAIFVGIIAYVITGGGGVALIEGLAGFWIGWILLRPM